MPCKSFPKARHHSRQIPLKAAGQEAVPAIIIEEGSVKNGSGRAGMKQRSCLIWMGRARTLSLPQPASLLQALKKLLLFSYYTPLFLESTGLQFPFIMALSLSATVLNYRGREREEWVGEGWDETAQLPYLDGEGKFISYEDE